MTFFHRFSSVGIAFLALVAPTCCSLSFAAPVTFVFEGEVDFLPVGLSTSVNLGDPFVTSITFESTTPDTAPGTTGGEYAAITSVSSTIGSLNYNGGAGTINIVDNFATDTWKGVATVTGPAVDGIDPFGVQVRMEDFVDLTNFTTDALPTFATTLNGLSSVREQRLWLNTAMPGASFRGTVTKVTNPISFELPVPGGGGALFDLQAVDILGEGATSNGLQSLHRLDAQSVAGSEPVDVMNKVFKSFIFSREDGESDPQTVFLGGLLEGLLAADNGGDALVDAELLLLDASGAVIGSDSYQADVNPGIGFLTNAPVIEELAFDALLTPGESYTLTSRLRVAASSPLGGAGRALFADTFDVTLSGEPIVGIPEPSTLWLGGLAILFAAWRKRI